VYDHVVARAFRILQQSADSDACAEIGENRRRGQPLGTLEFMLSTAPGMSWLFEVHVSAFADGWAVVLRFDDAEDRQVASFPTVLGFASQTDFPWSVAAVLAHDWIGMPAETSLEHSDWSAQTTQLLVLCWSRDGDEVGLGRDLVRLDRADLVAFLNATRGLGYIEVVKRIYSRIGELEEDDEGDAPEDEPLRAPTRIADPLLPIARIVAGGH
jgi:hypothetical protein